MALLPLLDNRHACAYPTFGSEVGASHLNPMLAFAFFLCHHKANGGAMSRFPQYQLQAEFGRHAISHARPLVFLARSSPLRPNRSSC